MHAVEHASVDEERAHDRRLDAVVGAALAQHEAMEARVTRAAQNLPAQLAPAPTAKATLTAEQRARIEAKRKEAQRRRAAAAQLQPALPHAQLTGQEGGGIESIAPMIAGQQRCTSPL